MPRLGDFDFLLFLDIGLWISWSLVFGLGVWGFSLKDVGPHFWALGFGALLLRLVAVGVSGLGSVCCWG